MSYKSEVIVLGNIYRHPHSDIDVIMEIYRRKLSNYSLYLIGDFYISLFVHEDHIKTIIFIN